MSLGTTQVADLSEVATSTIVRLREAIEQGRLKMPVTRASLLDHGIRNQVEPLQDALSGHTALACLSVLDVILAERRAHTRQEPELVWSGPERANSTARDTAIVLRAMFERAQRQVILAGFNFTNGSSLLEPLWIGMKERGVDVRFFIHIKQTDHALGAETDYGDRAVSEAVRDMWPFGAPFPRVYYDARTLAPRPYVSMHAKCVVVDGECALVTSANFTLRAQEHNTECGVFLEDAKFAHHLARQWLGLIEAGFMKAAKPTAFVP